MTKKLAA